MYSVETPFKNDLILKSLTSLVVTRLSFKETNALAYLMPLMKKFYRSVCRRNHYLNLQLKRMKAVETKQKESRLSLINTSDQISQKFAVHCVFGFEF